MLESDEDKRVTGRMPPMAEERSWPVWRRWIETARELDGDLGHEIRSQRDLRHIRLWNRGYGYEVIIMRGGRKVVRRRFRGVSQQSLKAAMRFRDEALETVPPDRSNSIPTHVLQALGVLRPVIGVYRVPQRRVYRVNYRDPAGKTKTRQFYFRQISEATAYAAAVAFRKEFVSRSEVAKRPIAVLPVSLMPETGRSP